MESCVNCKHEGMCDKIRKVYCQGKKFFLWEPKRKEKREVDDQQNQESSE